MDGSFRTEATRTILLLSCNDNALNALALPLDAETTFSPECATAEIGEPNPGIETGNTCDYEEGLAQDGWCETSVDNTIWYSFISPSSGWVRIEFTGDVDSDAQAALWKVTNPANFDTFTLIAANDDRVTSSFAANHATYLVLAGDG